MNAIIVAMMPGAACDGPGVVTTRIQGVDMTTVPPFEKRCARCGEVRVASEFYAEKRNRDGLSGTCRTCVKAKSREWYAEHREHAAARNQAWRAAHPVEMRAYRQAWADRHPDLVLGVKERLRAWNRSYQRGWYERNRQAVIDRTAAWAQEHPERARATSRIVVARRRARRMMSGGMHTLTDWRALCERYSHRCLACGRGDVGLTEDHITALSRGGSDAIENIQPLCLPCNQRKGTRTIDYRPDAGARFPRQPRLFEEVSA